MIFLLVNNVSKKKQCSNVHTTIRAADRFNDISLKPINTPQIYLPFLYTDSRAQYIPISILYTRKPCRYVGILLQ